MAWLCCHCGSLRADNVCVYVLRNSCDQAASASLSATNAVNVFCLGSQVTRGAATNWSPARTRVDSMPVDPSRCSWGPVSFLTNAPIFSHIHWSVAGPGSYATNSTNLSATFCPTNELSVTADSSDDITWEFDPVPEPGGPAFVGDLTTGRTISIRAGGQCGLYTVRACPSGLYDCPDAVTFKVVKTTSLTASGGVESYPAGGSNCYVTYPPVYGPPSPVTVTASFCPEPVLTNYVPACWRWDTQGDGISGSNLLSRTVDPTQPGTNDLTVVCGTSSNSCRVIALWTDIVEAEGFAAAGQTNGVLGDSVGARYFEGWNALYWTIIVDRVEFSGGELRVTLHGEKPKPQFTFALKGEKWELVAGPHNEGK